VEECKPLAVGGSILPGITRKSIMVLAEQKGYTVEERPVSVDEMMAVQPHRYICPSYITSLTIKTLQSPAHLDPNREPN